MLALAACGSSGSTVASGSKAPDATSSSSSGAPKPTGLAVQFPVNAASNAKLGSILVDDVGRTLYTLTDASGKAVACTGQCATFWPPLLLPGGVVSATAGAGVTGLGVVNVATGTQVTENGRPLYGFSGDAAAGDANGEGVSSFGGTWHTVKASAAAGGTATTAAPAPTDAPTTTNGYGY